MNVLVTYASKHGATEEIAKRIADRLQRRSHPVVARSVELSAAADFVRRNAAALSTLPVWLQRRDVGRPAPAGRLAIPRVAR